MKPARAVPGIWRDKRVPDLSDVLTPHLDIDPAEFAKWLAPMLAEYRTETAIREALPTRSAELAYLDELVAAVEGTSQALRPAAIPDRVQAILATEGLGAEVNWFQFRSRLALDLGLLRTLALRTRSTLAAVPRKAGAKSKRSRDALLAAVVDRLRASGLPDVAAIPVAEEILVACRIKVPGRRDSIERAERKARKK